MVVEKDERYSIGEVVAIVGASRPTIVGWLNRGLLRPARPGRGQGRPRLFSWRDLVWLSLAHELSGFGVQAERCARFADETVDALLEGRGRWLTFVPDEHGFEFSIVQNASRLANILEPSGRPGPTKALVLNGELLLNKVRERAGAVLMEDQQP